MKYTAHMSTNEAADTKCQVEFEVFPSEVEGLSREAVEDLLSRRAVDALIESGTVDIWYEEA